MEGALHRNRAIGWACALLLLGLLAEGTALYRAGLPELTLPEPARLVLPTPNWLPERGRLYQPVMALPLPEEPDPAVRLTVETLLQKPALPNGCEVTSLAMVLGSLGYDVTPVGLAQNHMPQGWLYVYPGVTYADDPAQCYVGDPASEYGYYMLAPALVKTAESYLTSQGSSCVAADVSGLGEAELEALLRSGTPVIVWATLDYGDARRGEPWALLPTGEPYCPYTNLHCRVLVGADETCFYVNDPLYGEGQAVRRDRFMHGYRALGSQAVIVTRRSHISEAVRITSPA